MVFKVRQGVVAVIGPDLAQGARPFAVGNDELGRWARRLAAEATSAHGAANGPAGAGVTGAELIDRVQLLEHLSSAIAAEQARTAAAFSDLCNSDAGSAGDGDSGPRQSRLDDRQRRARVRSTGAQIALARKASPARGRRLVELSTVLVRQLPHTLAALAVGALTESRAFAIAAATHVLTAEDRAETDRRLCADPGRIAHLGDRAVEDAARAVVEALDRGAAAERIRRAEADRHVSLRRLPDAMAKLTAILPITAAMAVREALTTAAETAKAAGDARTLGQLAADTLIERTTGLADAGRIPLRIGLVMTERTLLAGDTEPAHLPGYGTVPAEWARELIHRALGEPETPGTTDPRSPVPARERVWLERLYTHPGTGQLAAMDSKARLFPATMARFLRLRDHTCRTPYCDAPPRHTDHITPAAEGGPTTAQNGQCLCANCNLTKESPGWKHTTLNPGTAPPGEDSLWEPAPRRQAVRALAWATSCPKARARIAERHLHRARPPLTRRGPRIIRHTVETRTPTGHTYHSTPPTPPGSPGP